MIEHLKFEDLEVRNRKGCEFERDGKRRAKIWSRNRDVKRK